jgi:hypothetical protein
MLMIAGASGSGAPFKRAADYLAARHTVVIYDRRRGGASWMDRRTTPIGFKSTPMTFDA